MTQDFACGCRFEDGRRVQQCAAHTADPKPEPEPTGRPPWTGRGSPRCEYCGAKIKRLPVAQGWRKYAPACRKCGRFQSWAKPSQTV